MKALERIQADPRVACCEVSGHHVEVVLRAGWWPMMIVGTPARVASRLKAAKPWKPPGGQWPDVVGLQCAVPPAYKPGKKPRRHQIIVVKSQSSCGHFIFGTWRTSAVMAGIHQARNWQPAKKVAACVNNSGQLRMDVVFSAHDPTAP